MTGGLRLTTSAPFYGNRGAKCRSLGVQRNLSEVVVVYNQPYSIRGVRVTLIVTKYRFFNCNRTETRFRNAAVANVVASRGLRFGFLPFCVIFLSEFCMLDPPM